MSLPPLSVCMSLYLSLSVFVSLRLSLTLSVSKSGDRMRYGTGILRIVRSCSANYAKVLAYRPFGTLQHLQMLRDFTIMYLYRADNMRFYETQYKHCPFSSRAPIFAN